MTHNSEIINHYFAQLYVMKSNSTKHVERMFSLLNKSPGMSMAVFIFTAVFRRCKSLVFQWDYPQKQAGQVVGSVIFRPSVWDHSHTFYVLLGVHYWHHVISCDIKNTFCINDEMCTLAEEMHVQVKHNGENRNTLSLLPPIWYNWKYQGSPVLAINTNQRSATSLI